MQLQFLLGLNVWVIPFSWILSTVLVPLQNEIWRCRGLNPGPFTCKANALPLRYIPFLTFTLDTWILIMLRRYHTVNAFVSRYQYRIAKEAVYQHNKYDCSDSPWIWNCCISKFLIMIIPILICIKYFCPKSKFDAS